MFLQNLSQSAHLKKLLVILTLILVAMVIFSAVELRREKNASVPKTENNPAKENQDAAPLTEEEIQAQLEKLNQGAKEAPMPPTEEEIQAQLEKLNGGKEAPAPPTEEEIRAQLEKLNK